MPEYYAAIVALFVLRLLDRTDNTLDHDIHCSEKPDANGPILMKLWLGEVRYSDGEFRIKTSPSHNFINIDPLTSRFSLKCIYESEILSL